MVSVFELEAGHQEQDIYYYVSMSWVTEYCGIFGLSSQGYQGMVDGGDNIKEATWESVSSMLQVVRKALHWVWTCS